MTRMRLGAVLFLSWLLAEPFAHASGVLLTRPGGVPLQIQSRRVQVTLADGMARTTLRQTFFNTGSRAVEGVYLFPLPEGASLVDLAMEVGPLRLEGFLAERRTARRAYDSLVRRRVDPALVEQVGRSSRNSSKPPSSDSPGFKPPERRKGSGRKRGGQRRPSKWWNSGGRYLRPAAVMVGPWFLGFAVWREGEMPKVHSEP